MMMLDSGLLFGPPCMFDVAVYLDVGPTGPPSFKPSAAEHFRLCREDSKNWNALPYVYSASSGDSLRHHVSFHQSFLFV